MARPAPRFHDFIGHKQAVDVLRRQLAGAMAHKEPFPHSLFQGPSGVGKTLLAKALAAEYGTSVILATGYESKRELAELFVGLSHGDFVFVDEAHRLSPPSQELLYQVIDDLFVPDPRPKEGAKHDAADQEVVMSVKPCTVILATDQPGMLLNALQKRMEIQISLGFYTVRELKEIVDRLATDMSLLVSPQAARLIATVSGGLPRKAKHCLKNLRRHFPDSESVQLTSKHVHKFLRDFQVDEKGLGPQEHKYLAYLQQAGVASLGSLAIHLGVDQGFVQHQIEPIVRRHNFVVIGTGGRHLTDSGLQWIENRKGQKGGRRGKPQGR